MTSKGDRWEIATQRSHETHRMGYGQTDYKRTIEHLRRRGDTHARVWREATNEWVQVQLTRRKDTA